MERKISLWLYASAFGLSLAMFLAGLYIGSLIDSSNLGDISEDVVKISDRVSSLQLLLLMEENSSSFCPVYTSELASIDSDVENLGYRLSYLEEMKQVSDPDLKKRYFVLEAESYLLSKKVRTACGGSDILLINFYSNNGCPDCEAQGTEVMEMRDDLESKGYRIKLFSFDGTLGSPVADALATQYSVTSYPTVVIDETAYPGFRTSDELSSLITGAGSSSP